MGCRRGFCLVLELRSSLEGPEPVVWWVIWHTMIGILLGEHCSCRRLGVQAALAWTSLCFCCGALVVGCSSRPLTLARLCPCDCCPDPSCLQCLSALLAAFPRCCLSLPQQNQARLLSALGSPCLPHRLLQGELLPKPALLLPLMPSCAFPQPALQLLVLG